MQWFSTWKPTLSTASRTNPRLFQPDSSHMLPELLSTLCDQSRRLRMKLGYSSLGTST